MKNIFHVFILSLVVILAGCVAPSGVTTSTTPFYIPSFKSSGKISVLSGDQNLHNSLEFSHYKSRFEEKLSASGFSIVQDPDNADFVAFVTYGIDGGQISISSTPIIGQTGGGSTYSTGTISGSGGTGSYSDSSYSMPTYGIVGSTSTSYTTYTRVIAMDIVDAHSLKQGNVKKVYETRAKSTGSCSIISAVFDKILEAMFNDFPGQNGKSVTVTIYGETNC